MSLHLVTDRELLLETRRELDELREQVAELGVRVTRLGVLVDDATGTYSARVPALLCGALRDDRQVRCVRPLGHAGEHWYEARS